MKSHKAAVATSLITSATIAAAIVMLVKGDRETPVPVVVADVCRGLVILMAVYALGLMLMMIHRLMGVKLNPDDELMVPSFAVLMGLFCCEVFIILYLATRLGRASISWPTVLAFTGMILLDVGLTSLLRRICLMVLKAGNHGIVKFTMTETSHPGPDIDLSPSSPNAPTKEVIK
jgi:hypothetical protein